MEVRVLELDKATRRLVNTVDLASEKIKMYPCSITCKSGHSRTRVKL